MYLDTAILLKLFVPEADSEHWGNIADGQTISSSILAYTEIWSALLQCERAGKVSTPSRHRAWTAFHRTVTDSLIELLPMDPAVFKRANLILEACFPTVQLRSLDAMHLASADQAQDWPLVTNDKLMRDAAAIMGFPLSPMPA
jgi:predicted nucleic acid-binding protein